jgi:DNA replication protein DnaC
MNVNALSDYLRAANLPKRQAVTSRGTGKGFEAWEAAYAKLSARLGKGAIMGMHGGRGVGKTQMAVALARAACKIEADKPDPNPLIVPAFYCRAVQFFMAVKSTYRKDAAETEEDVVARYCKPRLLIIDEAHERPESTWAASLLTLVLDERYADGRKDTLILANCQTGKEFADLLGPSIASRAQEGGGFVDCSGWGSLR